MNQYCFFEVYGFIKGKYTYYGKNVTLWRRLTDNTNGKIKEMPLIENGGSFGWRIQREWINRDKMKDRCKPVKLKIKTPF